MPITGTATLQATFPQWQWFYLITPFGRADIGEVATNSKWSTTQQIAS
jgi:hypothetical protein